MDKLTLEGECARVAYRAYSLAALTRLVADQLAVDTATSEAAEAIRALHELADGIAGALFRLSDPNAA